MTSSSDLRISLIVARFNGLITSSLLRGARAALAHKGVPEPEVVYCGGAWELPVLAGRLAAREDSPPDAVVALGCVVRGHTPHFDYVAGEAAAGLGRVATEWGMPIAFGVLTTETMEQAFERVQGIATNKGWEAALTVIDATLAVE